MELQIDRLTLDVPGLSDADGRRLAVLVAEGLASREVPEGPAVRHRLSLNLAADADESLPILAGRIARELLVALVRS